MIQSKAMQGVLIRLAAMDPGKRDLWLMVGRITLIHFVVEALIMGLLSGFMLTREVVVTGLVDCALLSMLTTWPIYSWVARPFIVSAREAKFALQRELGAKAQQATKLEATLREMRELLGQNEALRQSLQRANSSSADINERILQRIGADLHDGPAQLLTYSLMRLSKFAPMLERMGGAKALDELATMRIALTDTLSELRNVSRGLSLPQLETATLAETVALAVAQHQEQTGTHVIVKTRLLPAEVPQPVKACIYRVVQEALANCAKHGKAANQTVEVQAGDLLVLTISDNGPGLEPGSDNGSGLGLNGMRTRVEALGGRLDLVPTDATGGCTVRVRLPIDRAVRHTVPQVNSLADREVRHG